VLDARGLLTVPGFIDGHVHILGGGGEGGPATRCPELVLSDAIRGGVTSLIGCLGTDGLTRTMPSLLAKAQGLEEEGLSTYLVTGHYTIPVRTLTGSVEEDLLYIDKVIGVGEVALSDRRSSQPSFEAFVRVAAESLRGGILSGKAGTVIVHLGDGPRGLGFLTRALAETELPARLFLPTHINRNPALLAEGTRYARAGGFVDFTTSSAEAVDPQGEIPAAQALRRMLADGVDPGHITFTSDGQGSIPLFDEAGRLRSLEVGKVASLHAAFREAVLGEGVPMARALQVITSNPAERFGLRRKGHLAPGQDADLVLLDPVDLRIHSVVAKGRILMKEGRLLAKGTFE
jgi:beta-aspartyl-dipeptidase (metallo-type)